MIGTKICGAIVAMCQECGVGIPRTFYYQEADAHKNPTHCECGGELVWKHEGYRKHNVFPYEHPHLTGSGPVVVESLHHLRKLEKQYGVSVHAFNQDSDDSPKDLPTFRPKGRDWRER